MNTETNTPDHKLAADELAALFAKLPVKTEIANGRAGLDLPESKEGRAWAHYACEVVYRDAANGKELARLPYKMGTGFVKWDKLAKRMNREGWGLFDQMANPRLQLTPESQAKAVSFALPEFAAAVKPAEVLASHARDAVDTSGQSFDEWCENYGYDTDSRKALETYLSCQAGEPKVRAICGRVCSVSQLAELASRL
jgi:hypothetical protein